MKNHLKRIATPRTWIIDRKANTFIQRPKPGAHPLDMGMSLGVMLRDKIQIGSTLAEVKKILNTKEILIDGKRRKSPRFIVGLFDVITLPMQNYRVVLDNKGRIVVKKIDQKEAAVKPCKVVGKTMISGGKIQLNLHDGKNILSTEKVKVGDSLLIHLPDLKIEKVMPLEKGSTIFLTKGKHAGISGALKEIKDEEVTFTSDKQEIETAKEYIFVVGEKSSEITLA
jgi:small subunit ribosomal protein S4e